MTNQRPDTILLRGGLDLETPAVAVRPGTLIGGVNYEPVAGGYRRLGGHERFDGRPKPSRATYAVLRFTDGQTAVSLGDIVTGATSGATGKALIAGVIESGTTGGGDAAGYLVLTAITGTFQDDENLQVSASTVAVADGTQVSRGAETDALDAAWMLAAATTARALIAKPAGSGPVRGVFALEGETYCVRDNAGATAGVLFKATSAGWAAQSLGHIVRFTAGSAAFVEGETITKGGTSAVVRRVVVQSGTYGGSDAAGFLVVSGIASGPFTAGAATGSIAGAATVSGAEVANALPAGGRYRFVSHNFRGAASEKRAYGVNGVGRAFEWDGAYFTPIETGLSDALDKPTHVAEFGDRLWLGYAAGAALYSELGEPLQWTVNGGAGEVGLGDVPTNLLRASTVLVIGCSTSMHYVERTANSSGDDVFPLRTVSEDSGALAHTMQQVDTPYYFDGGAIRRLTQTEALGGWRMGDAAPQIERFWRRKKEAGVTPVASYRVRARGHYVILLSDGSGVTTYLGRRNPEPAAIEFPFTAHCAYSGDDTGEEAVLVGTSDGWVMQLDSGRDNDGAEITALGILGWITKGSPQQRHRWHTAEVELDGGGTATLSIAAEFDYGDPDNPTSQEADFIVTGAGGRWNEATWNEFAWSSPAVGKAAATLDGLGRNIGVAILTDSTFEPAHTLQTLTLWSTPRGLRRGN